LTVRTCIVNLILCCVMLCATAGCSTTQHSSTNARFRMADLDQAIAQVRDDLVTSRFVREAQLSSSRTMLRARPLVNLSLDRFTASEEQLVVSRLFADPAVQNALRDASILLLDPQVTRPEDATHELFAEIRSLAREGASRGVAADARRDAYLLEYRIVARGSTEIVWQATTEVARAASGLVID
jgi:hypothetical protein